MANPVNKEVYIQQITAIQAKLDRGTSVVRQGHKVKDINPDGVEKEVSLSSSKRGRLRFELAILRYHDFGEKITGVTIDGCGKLLPSIMVECPIRRGFTFN